MFDLRPARLRAGLTIADLARRLSAADGREVWSWQNYLSRLESGKVDPKWSTVVKIASALGCSVEEMRGEKK